eukprot:5892809-Prorocentrum_lima.AAC.1
MVLISSAAGPGGCDAGGGEPCKGAIEPPRWRAVPTLYNSGGWGGNRCGCQGGRARSARG